MTPIIECVPNFSEGRDPIKIEAIANAIRAVDGTRILNISSDADHNRTVITFIGSPEAVAEGAFQAIAIAKQLIDLTQHEGEHPRIGATDVCPLIPVQDVTIHDCIALSEQVAERVGRELGICTYLYNESAKLPERRNLPNIRKGEYELWKTEIGLNPTRDPDFGPDHPTSWGATVIGARQFMIAYNIFLTTNDVKIAKKISAAIRHSSGGFRYLQAKGFLVDDKAQVSMNFHNFKRTPLHRVTEAIRTEAQRYGVTISHAELIGLIPQQALINAAKWYLQLDIKNDEIIESHL